jgi:hypothetical protein
MAGAKVSNTVFAVTQVKKRKWSRGHLAYFCSQVPSSGASAARSTPLDRGDFEHSKSHLGVSAPILLQAAMRAQGAEFCGENCRRDPALPFNGAAAKR